MTKLEILKQICHIARNTTNPSTIDLSEPKESHKIFLSKTYEQYALVGDILYDFDIVIKRLLEEGEWRDKFSEKYIENTIRDLIFKIRDDMEMIKASSYFSQLIDDLSKYSEQHSVYIPLDNIVMDESEVELGNVLLMKMTDFRADRIIDEYKITESYLLQSYDDLRNKVCAIYNTIAEPERSEQRAEEETRRAIDLVHYSTIAIYPDDHNITVGLRGEAFSVSRTTFVLQPNGDKHQVHHKRAGALHSFELVQPYIEKMESIGTFKISELLKKNHASLTSYERSLLRGIRWLSTSFTQFEKQSELLSLVTSLENIIPKNGQNITEATSKGAAIIVVKELIKPEYQKREKESLEKWIRVIYDKRSTISHGGHVEVTDDELNTLKRIIFTIIKWMIKELGTFKNRKSLFQWTENQDL